MTLTRPARPNRFVLVVAIVAVCITSCAMIAKIWLTRVLDAPLIAVEGADTVLIERGSSLYSVLHTLAQKHGLPYPGVIAQWAKWQKIDRSLKAGEYRIERGMSVRVLLNNMAKGEVVTYQLTIPEGLTLEQALAVIQAHAPLSVTLEGAADPRLRALVAPEFALEGWFLPQTYQYVRGDTDLSILRHANALMRKELQAAWDHRHADLPLESLYDVLILASIVERETAVADERPVIAGVFTRRLKKKMRLQTDPTVIYGLGSQFDGNLTRTQLRDKSNAWNTYQHHGLPPTPIALPGRDAIRAVTQPEEGNALYFVAVGDGTHVFSATLDDHNDNVRRYQFKRRVDYRSTP